MANRVSRRAFVVSGGAVGIAAAHGSGVKESRKGASVTAGIVEEGSSLSVRRPDGSVAVDARPVGFPTGWRPAIGEVVAVSTTTVDVFPLVGNLEGPLTEITSTTIAIGDRDFARRAGTDLVGALEPSSIVNAWYVSNAHTGVQTCITLQAHQ